MRDLFRIIRLFLRQWKLLVWAAVFTALQCAAQLCLPRLMATVVDDGALKRNVEVISHFGAWMLIVCVIMGISGYLTQVLCAVGSQKFALNLRKELYGRICGLSVTEVSAFGDGSLITRVTADVGICASMMEIFLQLLLEPVLLLLGGVTIVWSIMPKLGLIFLLFTVFQILLMLFFIRGTAPLFLHIRRLTDRFNSRLQAVFSRLRLIKIYTKEDAELRDYGGINAEMLASGLRVQRLVSLFHPLVMLVVDFSVAAILIFAGANKGSGNFRVGNILEAITYAQQILLSIIISGRLFQYVTEAAPSARRIAEVLDSETALKDGTKRIARPVSNVELKSISFQYPTSGMIFDGLDLSVERGGFLAVTGVVGCGKTTLAGLLARLYDTDEGSVLLDGTDIREFRLEDVRRHIALSDKQTAAIAGTFWDNIIFGRPYVAADDALKAAEAAQCAEIVGALPEGYDTSILSMGRSLSGGERQRLSIARALAGNPDFLILDDCTSSLDYITEQHLFQTIRKEYPDTAILLFTQRVLSAARADRIAYLDHGRVAHIGSEAELRRDCPQYRALYLSQQGEGAGYEA